MDEGVVERRVDVCDSVYKLALRDLGAEGDGGFFTGGLDFLGRLHPIIELAIHHENNELLARRGGEHR